jgi:shikimate dehydrogenase
MHAAALAAIGSPLSYVALVVPPASLDAQLEALVLEPAAGNVTIPHKFRVAARCGVLTQRARRAGAVNVFWVGSGALIGDNTDIPAFAALAQTTLGHAPAGLRIALLGAGGAAAAVLTAAEQWPDCSVTLFNRSRPRAESLAERFPIHDIAESSEDAVRDATLVVNATALGLHDDDPFPVAIDRIPSGAAVVDLVYRPRSTAWVRAASAAGRRARDGMDMLLEQGALAFERWMGVQAPRAVMRDALARHAGGDVS